MTTTSPDPRGTAWVLAADHGVARLFEAPGPKATLVPLETMINADARTPEAQLHRHPRGRQANAATGRQSSLGSRRSGRKFVTADFARRICRRLEAARAAGRLQSLYVVAQPEVLGQIRGHLTQGMKHLLAGAVPFDPAHLDGEGLRRALAPWLV